jgi:hypothetical protein
VIPIIQAIPWAKVYEADRYLGETPVRRAEFPVGKHVLRFRNDPMGIEKTLPVEVREGENPNLILTLVGSRADD